MTQRSMNKVLITGYHGFTGKILAALLIAKGYQVHGLSMSVDITDYPALYAEIKHVSPDYVIHLAAISRVINQNELDFYRINLLGTQNLLQALDQAKIHLQKIIVASSAYVYGNNAQDYLHEELSPQPLNHYGFSKLAMEHMAATWFGRFPMIILRPFNYTGPGQEADFLIPKIVQHFRAKKDSIELGNMEVVRDISDVYFTTEVYWRLLESPAHSTTVNVCSGIGYSIKDILAMLTEISAHKIQVNFNQELARKAEIFHLVGSNKKLFATIGEIPVIPLPRTLQDMYTVCHSSESWNP